MSRSSHPDEAIAAFIQGAFAGSALSPDFPVYIETVDNPDVKVAPNTLGGLTVAVERDEDGNYQNWFTITTRSGVKVRVTVELMLDEEERPA